MSSSNPKRALFAQFAMVAKAIGHEHRLELLEQLAQGERGVEALADRTGLSVANASHHLQQLRRGGLVRARRDGKFVLYRLSDATVLDLVAALRQIAERQIAEVDRVVAAYFRDRDSLEALSHADLMQRMDDGLVTVLDVRPEDEYALGHVAGAISVPLDKLKRRLKTLDRKREIVAYCRGAYCVLAFEAVALLRANGFRVRRLEDGFPEWKAAGLPVEEAAC
ncbi:MAG: metalloregulator ArsR/SmtB family transcription factor [Hyphomicrobiales bacterium]|nr:metalloregulator ArsR/SmtB family transcription factor [Hyphomicrobiales bacterium]